MNNRKSVLFWMCSMTMCWALSTSSATADNLKFPGTIKYDMVKNGSTVGSCTLTKDAKDDKFILRLKDFQGIGVASNDVITTYIFQDGLSLYDTFLERGGNVAYEMRLTKGESLLGGSGQRVFKFKKPAESTTETEVFAEFPVLDFTSSFLMASKKALEWKKAGASEQFNLFIDQSTVIIELAYVGKGNDNTHDIVMKKQGTEAFHFYIATKDEMTYPVKVAIQDAQGGSLELIANKASE